MGVIRFLSVRFVEVIVVLFLILFMPNIPPNVNFTHFKVSSPQNLEGKLALNNRLNDVEHLYQNELKGPEAFAEYNGELYTSLHGGDIVKLSKDHIVPIVKFGKACSGFVEESICGRPLGLEFDKNGILYVADAYMGIWKVDIQTGQKTLLISMDVEIEGKKPKLPNSLAISQNGDIYWTDSTTDFKLEDGVYTLLADGSGRVIHYDAKTKVNKVLMDGIHFANGVILSEEEEFIVVAETARSRLYRFWLKGPKKGTHDIFADNLPGMPDNLNCDGTGGFLVPLVAAVDKDNPVIHQIIGPFPWIRKLAARILALIEIGFKTVDKIYPNIYSQTAIHWVGHFESIAFFVPDRVTILHLSKSGDIIEAIHTVDKSVSSISEAYIFGDHLYLGSPYNEYIGRISLDKVGLNHLRKKRDVPVKQTTTPPPPTPVKQQTPPPTKKASPATTPTPTPSPPKSTQTKETPVKQAPSPPQQQQPPKQAPPPQQQKQAPPPQQQKQAPPPQQQQQPPKQTPQQPPKQAPQQQKQPSKQAPQQQQQQPPPKQATSPPPPAAKPTQPAAAASNPQKPKESDKAPKVISVKENSVPKSESIKPKN